MHVRQGALVLVAVLALVGCGSSNKTTTAKADAGTFEHVIRDHGDTFQLTDKEASELHASLFIADGTVQEIADGPGRVITDSEVTNTVVLTVRIDKLTQGTAPPDSGGLVYVRFRTGPFTAKDFAPYVKAGFKNYMELQDVTASLDQYTIDPQAGRPVGQPLFEGAMALFDGERTVMSSPDLMQVLPSGYPIPSVPDKSSGG